MEEIGSMEGMVKSDRTLLKILDTLHDQGTAGVTEIANDNGVSKGAVHKHLKTLEELDYVVNEDGRYRLGFKFFTYGIGVMLQSELSQLLDEKSEDLIEKTDEIVVASVEEHGMGTFLSIKNDSYNMSQVSRDGDRYNLHTCATGKAMLAELRDDEIMDIIDRYGLPEESENTITDQDELFEDLTRTRERGYATNLEELRPGINSVAAAVRHPETGEVGALAITGPSHRITEDTIDSSYADILLGVINELELQINYS